MKLIRNQRINVIMAVLLLVIAGALSFAQSSGSRQLNVKSGTETVA